MLYEYALLRTPEDLANLHRRFHSRSNVGSAKESVVEWHLKNALESDGIDVSKHVRINAGIADLTTASRVIEVKKYLDQREVMYAVGQAQIYAGCLGPEIRPTIAGVIYGSTKNLETALRLGFVDVFACSPEMLSEKGTRLAFAAMRPGFDYVAWRDG